MEGQDHVGADQAYILRLPPQYAEQLRKRLRDGSDSLQDLQLMLQAKDLSKSGFDGRIGTLSLKVGEADIKLPSSQFELPTKVEGYRTVDARSGDYVKTCDISAIVVVHDSEEEAGKMRKTRHTGRLDSGLTPPTHKITRAFAELKPHFTHLKKTYPRSYQRIIARAESHILRVSGR